MRLNTQELYRIIRFGFTGVIATLCHYLIYLVLLKWFSPFISYTGGYLVALVVNYLFTTYFTFQKNASTKNAFGFVISHLINYTLEIVVLEFLMFLTISEKVSGIITMVVVVPINYIILRFVYLYKKGYSKS